MTMPGQMLRAGRWIGSRFVDYTDWTDERIEILKALYKDGLSASQIAAELGGISRNAVIGKCHRLGLTGRPRKSSAPKQPRAQRRASGFARSDNRLEPIVKTMPLPKPRVEDGAIPAAQRKTLLQLDAHTCRWPVGDPGTADFFFCGAEPQPDRRYCEAHCSRAFDRQTSTKSRAKANATAGHFVTRSDNRGAWR